MVVVTGDPGEVSRLVVEQVLAVEMRPITTADGELVTRDVGVSEVVVPPRSPLVGDVAFIGQRRSSELVILGIRRLGSDVGPRPVELAAGDSLLLHGTWSSIE